MELLALAEEAAVGAALDGGAIGGDVEATAVVGFAEGLSDGGGLGLNAQRERQRIADPHSSVS